MSIHDETRRGQARGKALAAGLTREALDDAGRRIRAAQEHLEREINRVGIHVAGALAAGVRISEISELTGLSRQKVYELRDRFKGVDDQLPHRVAAQLAAAGALSADQLADQLGHAQGAMEAVVANLLQQHWVKPLITEYEGGSNVTFYKLDEAGEEALERWLIEGGEEPKRMTVYIGIEPTEKEPLRNAAIDLLGPEWFAIIEPGTAGDQTNAELAFHVVADDGDTVVARATERVRELRRVAGVEQRPVLITAILNAGAMDFLRWRDAGRHRYSE